MPGFGGSPTMALLTGLTQGFEKRRENQRAQERQDLINRQTEQQITESEERIKRADELVEKQQREAEAAQIKAAEELARQEAEAERDAEQRMVLAQAMFEEEGNTRSMAEIVAMMEQFPMGTFAQFFPKEKEETDPQIQAQREATLTGTHLRNRELRGDLEREEEKRKLRNSDIGVRLRSAFDSGDDEALKLVYESAVGTEHAPGLYTRDIVDEYLYDITPKNKTGQPKLNGAQKIAAQRDGELSARGMIALPSSKHYGNPASAFQSIVDAIRLVNPEEVTEYDFLVLQSTAEFLKKQIEEGADDEDEVTAGIRKSIGG